MTSLAIFGTGTIGGEVANLLNARGLVSRLVLYDINQDLLRAQSLDILHTRTEIRISTDPAEIPHCDIVICAAGKPRDPTVKTRADLLNVNIGAADACARYLDGYEGILITITNPMDIITYYLYQKTGIPKQKIIGFGAQLDSARFSYELQERGISSEGVIIGEHGEHQVPVFSRISGPFPEPLREEILTDLRGASMQIIKGKGATQYGPSWHISELVKAIIHDSGEIIPCCCVLEGEYGISGCSLAVPAAIGRNGILRIEEWNLDPWEQDHMKQAAEFVKKCSVPQSGAI
jgi:malate dehydrogenase